MTCKGVYASLGFSVYVTKENLAHLCKTGSVTGHVLLGKHHVTGAEVHVTLDQIAQLAIAQAYRNEKKIVDQAKGAMRSGYIGKQRTER